MIALRGTVGQEPSSLRAIGVSSQLLGALVWGWGGTDVDSLDVLGYIQQQRANTQRGPQTRIGPLYPLVPWDMKAGGTAEAVGRDRFEIRRGRLRRRQARLRAA